MAGLVPAIHGLRTAAATSVMTEADQYQPDAWFPEHKKSVDGRHKAGHDDGGDTPGGR
jgi:hypothetical protein